MDIWVVCRLLQDSTGSDRLQATTSRQRQPKLHLLRGRSWEDQPAVGYLFFFLFLKSGIKILNYCFPVFSTCILVTDFNNFLSNQQPNIWRGLIVLTVSVSYLMVAVCKQRTKCIFKLLS